MAKLNEYLLENAPRNLCVPAAMSMRGAGVNELLELYIKYIDYVLSEEYPSKEDLLKYGGSALAEHGIYVDSGSELNNPKTLVLLGLSTSEVTITDYSVSNIYIKHSSALDLTVKDNAFVIIDCFDSSYIQVNASGNAKVIINHYGNAEMVYSKQDQATVKVNHKYQKTY